MQPITLGETQKALIEESRDQGVEAEAETRGEGRRDSEHKRCKSADYTSPSMSSSRQPSSPSSRQLGKERERLSETEAAAEHRAQSQE